jgi:hypothetical protein
MVSILLSKQRQRPQKSKHPSAVSLARYRCSDGKRLQIQFNQLSDFPECGKLICMRGSAHPAPGVHSITQKHIKVYHKFSTAFSTGFFRKKQKNGCLVSLDLL